MCTSVLGRGVQIRFSTKSANFKWIVGAGIGFVEMARVDMYVGRDLKCWGEVALQQSDLISGYINIKNHIQNIQLLSALSSL